MKTIIKLLIVLVIINALVRAGIAASNYYRLKDAAQQIITFNPRTAPTELQTQIMNRARELEVPVAPENISVQREGPRTTADAKYVQPVELFPNYIYPVNLSFRVEALSIQ